MNADDIVAALGGRNGMARCPAHDDKNPSLSVTDKDGKVLVHCFAECPPDAVIDALRTRGLWPSKGEHMTPPKRSGAQRDASTKNEVPNREPDHVWTYYSEDGKPVRRAVRWDVPGGKVIRPQVPEGRSGWRNGDISAPRPLYNLPQLIERRESPVLVVEGEKTADAAKKIFTDYVVTTSAGGANAANKADWSPLRGRRVTVWPDNDTAGNGYAADVARLARRAGAADVRVVDVPALFPDGWDLADAIPWSWTEADILDRIAEAPPTSKAGGFDEPPASVTAHSLEELLALRLPPREMALAPWLPMSGLAMVFAKRGAGKTYFALQSAICIAAGSGFARFMAPTPRRTLYVDGEMNAAEIQARVASLVASSDAKPEPGMLRFVCADLQPEGLRCLSTEDGRAAIAEYVEWAEVIVFDNISTLFGAVAENENDAWEVCQRHLLTLRRAGKAVVLVHHASRAGTARGASRREDVLNSVIHLKELPEKAAADGLRVVVTFEKARSFHGAEAESFELGLTEAPDGRFIWTTRSEKDVMAGRVAELAKAGLSQREIAKELGVSQATVSRVSDSRANHHTRESVNQSQETRANTEEFVIHEAIHAESAVNQCDSSDVFDEGFV